MATGFSDKFAGRMLAAEAAIRAALAAGDSRRALHLARAAYGSEATKLRRRRSADGALTDAEMAASLLAVAEGLGTYKPARSGKRREAPSPAALVAAFDQALARARSEAAS
jgi:hypothetical protein